MAWMLAVTMWTAVRGEAPPEIALDAPVWHVEDVPDDDAIVGPPVPMANCATRLRDAGIVWDDT